MTAAAPALTSLAAAQRYVAIGLHPIPIPSREKAPKVENWPALRFKASELPNHFNGIPSNIGIILGDEYGVADVDLDCQEALRVAGDFLPETGMVFGRESKPRSHYFYRADPPIRSKRFLDPVDKQCLIELRCQKADGSTGLQTVVPPSIHPEGETIRFEPGCDGHPANVDASRLQGAVANIAAAALLARHWPGERSGRNMAFIALAGALARAGWDLEKAILFHQAIYRALWNARADLEAARAEVISTYEKHGHGFETTGRRSLAGLVDKRALQSALNWLGISLPSVPVREAPKRPVPQSFDMEVIADMEDIKIPELLIEGLVPKCGLLLLGGRPKDGKSWLACQLALACVTGQGLGGWLKVYSPGRVQLWALEDGLPITKDKVLKLLNGARPDGLRDMRVFAELPHPILEGGDEDIRAALREHPAELIILDSLFKLTGHARGNYDICQRDYDVIDRVRKVALDHSCAAVIIMHTKKGSTGGNPIENLLGTSGTTAVPDALAELKRYKSDAGKLTVVGRSVKSDDYELAWHGGPDQWGWSIQDCGDEGDSETGQEVLAYLDAQGESKPAIIAAALKKSFGSVWMALKRLQEKGKVTRMKDKRWTLKV